MTNFRQSPRTPLASVSDAEVDAYLRDIERGAKTHNDVLAQLARSNPRLALRILAEASRRKVLHYDNAEVEDAYIAGAMLIVGTLSHQANREAFEQDILAALENQFLPDGETLD